MVGFEHGHKKQINLVSKKYTMCVHVIVEIKKKVDPWRDANIKKINFYSDLTKKQGDRS